MSFLPFALSLSSTFTKIGAIAAFAALVGIAVLSLLVFSQARELKRLREWAGRAPERAADLEQRVSSAAAARVQQQPPADIARPVVRTAPMCSSGPIVMSDSAEVTSTVRVEAWVLTLVVADVEPMDRAPSNEIAPVVVLLALPTALACALAADGATTVGEPARSRWPATSTRPVSAVSMPKIISTVSVRPEPSSPARPTTSPA